jgi:hypothetical protein
MNDQEKKFHIASHKAQAEHAAEMAKCFSKSADCHAELASASEMSDPAGSKTHGEIAKSHGAMAKSCIAAGEHHLACCDKLDAIVATNEGDGKGSSELKIILGELQKLSTGLPAGLSAIPRNNNPTLVPRPGQPDRDTEKALKDSVQPELKDIIFNPREAVG